MKKIVLILVLVFLCAGCSYWPQTLRPSYYGDGVREVKEDIDDVTGARTL